MPSVRGSAATELFFQINRGNIVGGWQECSVAIVSGETRELVVNKHPNIEKLREITKSASFGFSPEVVRIVLNSSIMRFVGVDGDVVPPSKEDVPEKTYLSYGSSITHGSLALNIPSTFVSQIGEHFRCDVRNLGLAGNARLEKSVADEIAAMGERGEWDFTSLCMGINILDVECSDFEERVKNMIKTVAERNPGKHIFCISPFYCSEDMDGLNKPQLFREIVERSVCELGFPYVHYIDGSKILDGPWGLSGDLVHPPLSSFKQSSSENAWASCVLERLGIPMYFSDKLGGAVFIDGKRDKFFDDSEIKKILSRTVFFAAHRSQDLCIQKPFRS